MQDSNARVGGAPERADGGPKRKPSAARPKRQKVSRACVYCQRSHMSCNDERPCSRCVKRSIAHLCRDKEPGATDSALDVHGIPSGSGSSSGAWAAEEGADAVVDTSAMAAVSSSQMATSPLYVGDVSSGPCGLELSAPITGLTMAPSTTTVSAVAAPSGVDFARIGPVAGGLPLQTGFQVDPSVVLQLGNEMANNESTVLSEFLSFLQRGMPSAADGMDAGARRSNPLSGPPSMHAVGSPETDAAAPAAFGSGSRQPQQTQQQQQPQQQQPQQPPPQQTGANGGRTISLPTITQLMAGASGTGVTQTERFVMTAADPTDGTAEEKLHQIIHAKQEAGILKPYNYVGGYARMQRFLEANVAQANIFRILEVVNTIRPMFRKTARSLTDVDLVAVEEGFERLLLDYDNQFNAFGVPACLWRRTGEIYKANREFADLVGLPLAVFHEGRVCIYEIMSELSTVNYWEKYGEIAFDATQKAVLTSCVLQVSASARAHTTGASGPGQPVRCCFSFTLRRDKHKIPVAIVGNFLPAP